MEGAGSAATPPVWERPWTLAEIADNHKTWSLAGDAGLLLHLQDFSQRLMAKTHEVAKGLDDLARESRATDCRLHNTMNDFVMMANNQFVESRVYEEDVTDAKADNNKGQADNSEPTEADLVPKVAEAIAAGLKVVRSVLRGAADEDDAFKDPYKGRPLPAWIGSSRFLEDEAVGLPRRAKPDVAPEVVTVVDEAVEDVFASEDVDGVSSSISAVVEDELDEDEDMFAPPQQQPRRKTLTFVEDDEDGEAEPGLFDSPVRNPTIPSAAGDGEEEAAGDGGMFPARRKGTTLISMFDEEEEEGGLFGEEEEERVGRVEPPPLDEEEEEVETAPKSVAAPPPKLDFAAELAARLAGGKAAAAGKERETLEREKKREEEEEREEEKAKKEETKRNEKAKTNEEKTKKIDEKSKTKSQNLMSLFSSGDDDDDDDDGFFAAKPKPPSFSQIPTPRIPESGGGGSEGGGGGGGGGGLFDDEEDDEDDFFGVPKKDGGGGKRTEVNDLFDDKKGLNFDDDDDFFGKPISSPSPKPLDKEPTTKKPETAPLLPESPPDATPAFSESAPSKPKLPPGAVSVFGGAANPVVAAGLFRRPPPEEEEAESSDWSSEEGGGRGGGGNKKAAKKEEIKKEIEIKKIVDETKKIELGFNAGLFLDSDEEDDFIPKPLKPAVAPSGSSLGAPAAKTAGATAAPASAVSSIFDDDDDLFSNSTKDEILASNSISSSSAIHLPDATMTTSSTDANTAGANLAGARPKTSGPPIGGVAIFPQAAPKSGTDVKTSKVGALAAELKIPVRAPMDSPPLSRKKSQSPVEMATAAAAGGEASVSLLSNEATKSRARIRGNRRPPTRPGRREAGGGVGEAAPTKGAADKMFGEFAAPVTDANGAVITSSDPKTSTGAAAAASPAAETAATKARFPLDDDDDDDDSIFGLNKKTTTTTTKKADDDDNDDDLLFGSSILTTKTTTTTTTKKNLLDDDDDDDDFLFGSLQTKTSTTTTASKPREEKDGIGKGPTPLQPLEPPPLPDDEESDSFFDSPLVSRPIRSSSQISVKKPLHSFDDDDDDDDDDDHDIFSTAEIKRGIFAKKEEGNSAFKIDGSNVLSDDDEDIFKPVVKGGKVGTPAPATDKAKDDPLKLLDNNDDEDIFAVGIEKPTAKIPVSYLDDDDDDPDDIFAIPSLAPKAKSATAASAAAAAAAQKPTKKLNAVAASIFDDDDDDIFK